MEHLLTLDALISLVTLATLEVVLGIDNVIFVSIILGRIPEQKRLRARRIWMIGGILLRSVLLLGLGWLVQNGHNALFHIGETPISLRDLIMFCGGLFLLYKAVKEIHEKLEGAAVIIAMIVMFFFANGISGFIEKHPALKMLALSFLVMVGFMLFFEGLHPFHHSEIPKGYAYVAMAFSFGVELLNMRAGSRRVVKLNK